MFQLRVEITCQGDKFTARKTHIAHLGPQRSRRTVKGASQIQSGAEISVWQRTGKHAQRGELQSLQIHVKIDPGGIIGSPEGQFSFWRQPEIQAGSGEGGGGVGQFSGGKKHNARQTRWQFFPPRHFSTVPDRTGFDGKLLQCYHAWIPCCVNTGFDAAFRTGRQSQRSGQRAADSA